MSNSARSVIRTIYLYLFALVGLFIMIFAAIDFIDMGLKAYVFTEAERQEERYNVPPYPPEKLIMEDTREALPIEGEVTLSQNEVQEINNWVKNYKEWTEKQENVDYAKARRHEDAARNIAMLLVGLPLYLYHWRLIKGDVKKKNVK